MGIDLSKSYDFYKEDDHRVKAAHFFRDKCLDEIIVVACGFDIASSAKIIQIK